MTTYKTAEAAAADLLAQGFIRYISCVNGAELFSKKDGDHWPNRALCRIKHNWVAPQWGDDLNYFTIEFF